MICTNYRKISLIAVSIFALCQILEKIHVREEPEKRSSPICHHVWVWYSCEASNSLCLPSLSLPPFFSPLSYRINWLSILLDSLLCLPLLGHTLELLLSFALCLTHTHELLSLSYALSLSLSNCTPWSLWSPLALPSSFFRSSLVQAILTNPTSCCCSSCRL